MIQAKCHIAIRARMTKHFLEGQIQQRLALPYNVPISLYFLAEEFSRHSTKVEKLPVAEALKGRQHCIEEYILDRDPVPSKENVIIFQVMPHELCRSREQSAKSQLYQLGLDSL